MSTFHDLFSWIVVLVNGIAGAWATTSHWVESIRVRPMWWLIHAGHAAVAIQVTAGVWLVARDGIDVNQIHTFYGFLTMASIGLIIGYRHLSQYRFLLYGLGGLFVMGLAIRAMTISPAP